MIQQPLQVPEAVLAEFVADCEHRVEPRLIKQAESHVKRRGGHQLEGQQSLETSFEGRARVDAGRRDGVCGREPVDLLEDYVVSYEMLSFIGSGGLVWIAPGSTRQDQIAPKLNAGVCSEIMVNVSLQSGGTYLST